LIWSPVIEEDFGQERFLSDHPINLIESGEFEHVPVVIGVTKDEFANLAFPLVANASLLQELSDNFEVYAPVCFIYERNTDKSKEVSAASRTFYLGDEPLSNASLPGLANLFADSVVGFPVHRAANLIAEKNSEPVYFYEFTYQGRYSHFYLPDSNGTVPYGVVHHDDLIYLFYISAIFPYFDETYPEIEMVEKLSLLWANFAKTGNPTPDSNPLFGDTKWEKYNITDRKYLEIGKDLVLRDSLYAERYDFWENLFPDFCISDCK
jgi:carboxylesterase type B